MVVKQLHIGVLTGRIPYPNGMAATQRIHLMARAMAEAGAAVNVWVDGLDGWNESRNPNTLGVKDGIGYEYLLGKTQASEHKMRRVWDRLAIAGASRRRVIEASKRESLDGLYFYTSNNTPNFERIVINKTKVKKKIPIVFDLCEAPWSMYSQQSLLEKCISPLWGVDGVICISRYLEDWVKQENRRKGYNVRTLYVPILTDTNEIIPSVLPPFGKRVLFAGSPYYDESLRFLLAAMEVVWEKHTDCELVITGGATEVSLQTAVKRNGNKIRFTGFIERNLLLNEYSAASVLAIPLFDDVQSYARFPTKLGEYLSSGRPVVTNQIGEISRFLEDGISACVKPSGDAISFAESICLLLGSPKKADLIGHKGREVAEKHFHFEGYGEKICDFFASL
ncbi:MAG: glycosyltransferase family 4 protein [Chlorobiaceae bacterium]